MSQGNQSLATRGPGQHLLPVLEEATSDGATLVLVFILTVIVTDPRTLFTQSDLQTEALIESRDQ